MNWIAILTNLCLDCITRIESHVVESIWNIESMYICGGVSLGKLYQGLFYPSNSPRLPGSVQSVKAGYRGVLSVWTPPPPGDSFFLVNKAESPVFKRMNSRLALLFLVYKFLVSGTQVWSLGLETYKQHDNVAVALQSGTIAHSCNRTEWIRFTYPYRW